MIDRQAVGACLTERPLHAFLPSQTVKSLSCALSFSVCA